MCIEQVVHPNTTSLYAISVPNFNYKSNLFIFVGSEARELGGRIMTIALCRKGGRRV